MNKNIRDYLFFFISFGIIFNNIPQIIQIPFIGNILQTQFVVYPIIIGLVYTLFCHHKYKKNCYNSIIFKKYIIIYTALLLISSVIGLLNYPYYDELMESSINQSEKLLKVYYMFQYININIDTEKMVMVWLILKSIVGCFLQLLYTFGVAYMIYCWYHLDYKQGIKIFTIGSSVGLFFIFIYSLIEILYLSGNQFSKDLLILINPYIHMIKVDHGWWPPLLWPNQLRSVFPEPSHIGNYAGFVIPLLWTMFIKSKKNSEIIISSCILYFTIIMFLTQSRTAIAMFLGMCALYFLFIFVAKSKKYNFQILKIFMINIIAFFIALNFINKINNNTSASEYITNNVVSVTDNNARSNGARYALIMSNARIAADHILIGVGNGLSARYIPDYFSDEEKRIKEINTWINNQREYGILRYPIGAMNEYINRLVETGILGLFAFLYPFIYVFYKYFKTIESNKKNINILFLITALLGSLVAGMNGSLNVIYSSWIILGLSYAAVLEKKNEKREKNRYNN